MSSVSRAAPFQCSATAAALASFSTCTGQRNERRSRSPSGSPVQPGSAVPRRTVPSASTMPGLPTPTARRESRGTPTRRSRSATAARTRSSRSSAEAASETSLVAGADDPAVQPGQQYRDPVRADLDAQQVSRLGPEPEPARGAPLPSRALLGIGLDDESGPHEPLDDPFDGRPGEPGHPCEIGEGRRFGSAQCPEHHG